MDGKMNAYVAVATPPGVSGLAVIRLAGPDAIAIADRLFRFGALPKADAIQAVDQAFLSRRLSDLNGYQAAFGYIQWGEEVIDQAVALCFKAPHSYTGEDVIEFSIHGGTATTKAVLTACVEAGARPAQPGEFTRNAFLNGKLDLSQAEAVIELIHAQTRQQAKAALHQLGGGLSVEISDQLRILYDVLSELELAIEYPEHEDSEVDFNAIRNRLMGIESFFQKLCRRLISGEVLKQGFQVVIVGEPNAGKSTLLNALSGQERAIVTPIAGTTRDVLVVDIEVAGFKVCLTDTAGLRDSQDLVEQIGVERARAALADAHLLLWVVAPSDMNQDLDSRQAFLDKLPKDKPLAILLNKTDDPAFQAFAHHFTSAVLPQLTFSDQQAAFFQLPNQGYQTLTLSAKCKAGFDPLYHFIETAYQTLGLQDEMGVLIQSASQQEAIRRATDQLSLIVGQLDVMPYDLTAQGLLAVAETLAVLVGQKASEAVIDALFSRFCVGK